MRDCVYTDAARFKQLSGLILDANVGFFPNRTRIEQIAKNAPGLSAWIREYRSPRTFMNDAKLFFYRERKRRPKAGRP